MWTNWDMEMYDWRVITEEEAMAIDKSVEGLPASKPRVREEIVQWMKKSSVVIIAWETWSGKSTECPRIIFDEYERQWMLASTWPTISQLQPRVLATINVAKRVNDVMASSRWFWKKQYAWHRNWKSSNIILPNKTPIVVWTPWYEAALYSVTRNIPPVVMLDEIHMDDTWMMILLQTYLRLIRLWKKDLQLFLQTATPDFERLIPYINQSIDNEIPIVSIEWRTFPIDKRNCKESDFMPEFLNSYRLWDNSLIFEDWKGPIDKTIEWIHTVVNDGTIVVPLHSQISLDDQEKITTFKSTPESQITIVATNTAQESLTLKEIDIVLDKWYVKQWSVNWDWVERIDKILCSQAESKQRMWRAWRVKPWKYIRFNKHEFEELEPFPKAEMTMNMFCKEILYYLNVWIDIREQMALDKKQNIETFKDMPNEDLLNLSYQRLESIGAIDKNWITQTWKDLWAFPLSVFNSKVLLESIDKHVSKDMLEVVSILENDWFLMSKWLWKDLYEEEKSANKNSDIFFQLKILRTFLSRNLDEKTLNFLWSEWGLGFVWRDEYMKWKKMLFECVEEEDLEKFWIKKNSLESIFETITELEERFAKKQIELSDNGDKDDKIVSLLLGYPHHVFEYNDTDKKFYNALHHWDVDWFDWSITSIVKPLRDNSKQKLYLGTPFIIWWVPDGWDSDPKEDLLLLSNLQRIEDRHLELASADKEKKDKSIFRKWNKWKNSKKPTPPSTRNNKPAPVKKKSEVNIAAQLPWAKVLANEAASNEPKLDIQPVIEQVEIIVAENEPEVVVSGDLTHTETDPVPKIEDWTVTEVANDGEWGRLEEDQQTRQPKDIIALWRASVWEDYKKPEKIRYSFENTYRGGLNIHRQIEKARKESIKADNQLDEDEILGINNEDPLTENKQSEDSVEFREYVAAPSEFALKTDFEPSLMYTTLIDYEKSMENPIERTENLPGRNTQSEALKEFSKNYWAAPEFSDKEISQAESMLATLKDQITIIKNKYPWIPTEDLKENALSIILNNIKSYDDYGKILDVIWRLDHTNINLLKADLWALKRNKEELIKWKKIENWLDWFIGDISKIIQWHSAGLSTVWMRESSPEDIVMTDPNISSKSFVSKIHDQKALYNEIKKWLGSKLIQNEENNIWSKILIGLQKMYWTDKKALRRYERNISEWIDYCKNLCRYYDSDEFREWKSKEFSRQHHKDLKKLRLVTKNLIEFFEESKLMNSEISDIDFTSVLYSPLWQKDKIFTEKYLYKVVKDIVFNGDTLSGHSQDDAKFIEKIQKNLWSDFDTHLIAEFITALKILQSDVLSEEPDREKALNFLKTFRDTIEPIVSKLRWKNSSNIEGINNVEWAEYSEILKQFTTILEHHFDVEYLQQNDWRVLQAVTKFIMSTNVPVRWEIVKPWKNVENLSNRFECLIKLLWVDKTDDLETYFSNVEEYDYRRDYIVEYLGKKFTVEIESELNREDDTGIEKEIAEKRAIIEKMEARLGELQEYFKKNPLEGLLKID